MYVVLGGTGHVGSALAHRLLERGERVLIVTRREQNRAAWEGRGAEVAVLDLRDVAALRGAFGRARRAFVLNPPGEPGADNTLEERQTAQAILSALHGSELEGVVALSTYGAQPGDAIGDLGVLYELEQGLRGQHIPWAVIRAAYYLTNWGSSLHSARGEGRLYTFFPVEHELPMVAPEDIAELACRLLTSENEPSGIHHIEGPRRYTRGDVARAFATELGREVEVATIPEPRWVPTLEELGFSHASALSMAGMTSVTLHQHYETPAAPERGRTSLEQYVRELVRAGAVAS